MNDAGTASQGEPWNAPREVPPFTVLRYGRNAYRVKSEVPKSPAWYLVDFEDPLFPDGLCDCTDCQVRIESYVRRGEKPEKRNCKHARRALSILDGWRQVLDMQGIDADPADMIRWA